MPKRFRTQIEACNSFAELLAQILAQRELLHGKKLLKLDEKLIKTCEKFIDETERIKFQDRIIRKPPQRRNAKCSQTV